MAAKETETGRDQEEMGGVVKIATLVLRRGSAVPPEYGNLSPAVPNKADRFNRDARINIRDRPTPGDNPLIPVVGDGAHVYGRHRNSTRKYDKNGPVKPL